MHTKLIYMTGTDMVDRIVDQLTQFKAWQEMFLKVIKVKEQIYRVYKKTQSIFCV